MGSYNNNELKLITITPCPNILYRIKNQRAIIHNLEYNQKTILNDVGADIWNFIVNNSFLNIDLIVKYISNLYNVEYDIVFDDTIPYLLDLKNNFCILTDLDTNIINFNENYNNQQKSKSKSLSYRDDFYLDSVTLELTYECNEKCIHCYVCNAEKKLLSTSNYIDIIDQLFEMGVLYLSFTGGEALLRNDFTEIYEYAFDKGFVIDIYTNATLINIDYLNVFKRRHPRRFFISLYSMNEKIHDKITQLQGSFEKTIIAIENLKKMDISIYLNIPIMTLNIFDIKSIILWTRENKLKYKVSFNITAKNDGNTTPQKLQSYNDEELLNILDFIEFKSDDFVLDDDFVCGAGLDTITINPYGFVQPCVGLPITVGSIMENTIDNIWKNSKQLNSIRNVKWIDCDDCISCKDRHLCNHCMGLSFFETGNIKSKNESDCYISKIKSKFLNKKTTEIQSSY